MPGRSYLRVTESAVCDAQVACDGNYVVPKRMERGLKTCGACERVLAKRLKGPPKLKGSRLYPEDGDV